MTWNDVGRFLAEWSIVSVVVVGLLVLNVGSLRRRRYQKLLRFRRERRARRWARMFGGNSVYAGGMKRPRIPVLTAEAERKAAMASSSVEGP